MIIRTAKSTKTLIWIQQPKLELILNLPRKMIEYFNFLSIKKKTTNDRLGYIYQRQLAIFKRFRIARPIDLLTTDMKYA